MKRTHFTLLFLLISFNTMAQDGKIQPDGTFKGTWTSLGTGSVVSKENTYYKISFHPEASKEPFNKFYCDFREYFLDHFKGDSTTYECWTAQWAYQNRIGPQVRMVDVHVIWNGESKEYTFDEFKKYIWP